MSKNGIVFNALLSKSVHLNTQLYQLLNHYQKLKWFSCTLMAFLFLQVANGQDFFRNGYCGTWTKTGGVSGGKIDYYDRFGNGFAEEELLLSAFNLETVNTGDCEDTGIFNPNYIGNWTDNEQATICQLLSDLSDIIAPGQDGAFIDLLISMESLDFGILGNGTPNYDAVDCGITNSTMIVSLHGGGDNFSTGFIHGTLRISDNYIWHTLAEDGTNGGDFDNPDIGAGKYDLYSVALHEMMHVLGFASLITEDGSSITGEDIYSRWDSYLYSGVASDFLLEGIEDGDCCDAHQFNTIVDISSGVFGGSCADMIGFRADGMDIAIVADATNSGSNMLNRLSHLDMSCNNNVEQVMHPGLNIGEHRRTPSADEITILCELGYGGIVNGCNIYASCLTITNDDEGFIFYLSEGNTASISGHDLLANDLTSSPFFVSSVVDCGSELLDVVWDLANFEFDITFNGLGTLSFCYQIEGCDGYCDEATVTIVVLPEPIPTLCIGDQGCNLVCFGDFEDFIPGTNNYFSNLGIPKFEINIADNGGTDIRGNSPDVQTDNGGNQFLHLFYDENCGDCDFEGINLPLSAAIDPGCTANVSFEALNQLFPDAGIPTLKFFALTEPPCDITDYPYGCTNASFNLCSDVTATCMTSEDYPGESEGIPISSGVVNINNLGEYDPINFQSYSFNWTNNTGQAITHILLLSGNAADTYYDDEIHNYVDNISVTTDCQTPIEITLPSIETTACIDEVLDVDLQICLEGDGTTTQDVSIVLDPLPLDFTIVGGDFDAMGVANLSMILGDCATLNLQLNVPASYVEGTSFFIPVEAIFDEAFCVVATGAESGITIALENCIPIPDGFTCPCPNTINIDATGGRTLSSLVTDGTLPASQLNNNCLAIAGTLIVDVNYTIDGGEVLMQPGSSIRLPDADNATLTLSNINQNRGIHGCGEMWRGIRVEGAGCNLIMSNCQIEDAQHAVTAFNLAAIDLQGNDFNRNYVGVYVPPAFPIVFNAVPHLIQGNTFQSINGDLLQPFDNNLNPMPTNVTYAGLLINNTISFGLGGSGTNANTFNRILNGILANQVQSLNIWGNAFENITYGDPHNWDNYAIKANTSGLTVSGATFTNCKYGIRAENPRGLLIQNNIITDVSAAVHSTNSKNYDVEIMNNIIINARYGILVKDDFPNSTLRIDGNTVSINYVPPYGNVGIGVANAVFMPANSGEIRSISGNTIEGDIGVTRIPGVDILNNTISFSQDFDLPVNYRNHAIYVNESSSCQVKENSLTGNGSGSGIGIAVTASVNSSIECNAPITGYETSIGFFEDCSCEGSNCTQVLGNEMHYTGGATHRGLYMQNSIISNQLRTGNEWHGIATSSPLLVRGAVYFGPASLIFNSRFTTQTPNTPYHPQKISISYSSGGIGNPNDWFIVEGGSFYDNCGLIPEPGEPGHDDINHYLAEENTFPNNLGSSWIGKRHLYANLKEDASLITSADLQQFLSDHEYSSIGTFYELEDLLINTLLPSLEDASLMYVLSNTMKGISDELGVLNESLLNEADANALDQIAHQHYLFNYYNSLYKDLDADHHLMMTSKLNEGILLLNNLSTHTVPAENLKSTYLILLDMLYTGRNEPSEIEIAALASIAQQCVSDGGDGVLLARTLLNVFEEEGCGQAGLQENTDREIESRKIENDPIIRVYPNPAKEVVTISISEEIEEGALSMELFSTSGQLMLEQSFHPTPSYQISLDELPEGLYFYRIWQNGILLKQSKLVKQ